MPTSVTVNFPIDQNEQARQLKAEHLLPQDVYLKIATLIEANLAKLKNTGADSDQLDDIDDCRAHETILIDGGRGAGKSSVLVNLDMYLKSDAYKNMDSKTAKIKADDLLILKPVDPTLVENGDSLLLNIIVAALMRNKEVTTKLDKSDSLADTFYEQLQKLGSALEAVETQKSKHGIDRLRSFMGGHGLAQEIHKLFKATLDLTGKKLIILPIDDVDTSLHYAFENIEIVRKYLSSPYIIPIVSGDLNLYGEIIWRDFHGRIVKDSSLHGEKAKAKALELQEEYQRKIMPLNRRIDMPDYEYYAQQDNIVIVVDANKPIISLPTLFHWFNAVIHGAINGKENSKLHIPFNSIREMSQFITFFKEEVRDFNVILSRCHLNTQLQFTQHLINERLPATPNDSAEKNHEKEKVRVELSANNLNECRKKWLDKCKEYFVHEPKAGAIYLIAKANYDWGRNRDTYLKHENKKELDSIAVKRWIFETELFSPLMQNRKAFNIFEKKYVIRDYWKANLSERLPNSSWFENLIKKSILAYPIPEQGRQFASLKNPINEISGVETIDEEDRKEKIVKLEFVRLLMCHKNFYASAKRTNLLYCGRILELVVLSLIRDVSEKDIIDILHGQPFYSLASLAPTKPIVLVDDDEEDNEDTEEVSALNEDTKKYITDFADDFSEKINAWRNEQQKPEVDAWLVYNVFNKYFNQVNIFNPPTLNNRGSLFELRTKLNQSFNCLWSCFGGFEKGSLYHSDDRIAYQNVTATLNFQHTDLYNVNIKNLIEKGKGSITCALDSHPLKELITDINSYSLPEPEKEKKEKKEKKEEKEFYLLADELLTSKTVTDLLNMPLDSIKKLHQSVSVGLTNTSKSTSLKAQTTAAQKEMIDSKEDYLDKEKWKRKSSLLNKLSLISFRNKKNQ